MKEYAFVLLLLAVFAAGLIYLLHDVDWNSTSHIDYNNYQGTNLDSAKDRPTNYNNQ